MGAETEFKNWWRKRFKGVSYTHEPRGSIGEGFPDVTILRPEGLLLPIEMKIASGMVYDGGRPVLVGVKFEPAQPAWHIKHQRAGGVSLICIGVKGKRGDWLPYSLKPGIWLMEWEKGIPPENVSAWTLWE